jgi:hypothetical protein
MLKEEHELVLPSNRTDPEGGGVKAVKNLFKSLEDENSDNKLFDLISVEIHKLFS